VQKVYKRNFWDGLGKKAFFFEKILCEVLAAQWFCTITGMVW
jgi:hypothetical protein